MARSKKQERLFKAIILVFWAILTLVIVSILVFTGVIRFSWTDEIVADYQYKKNKNKDQRILVIGDSQLEKWPIPHCLNDDIEQFCIDNNIGLLNAAHHGFGPYEYLDLIKKHAEDFKPQMILLFYYTGNDLTDVMYRGSDKPSTPSHEVWKTDTNTKAVRKDSNRYVTEEDESPQVFTDEQLALLRESSFDWDHFKEKGVDTTLIKYAQNRILNPSKLGPQYVNPHVLVMGTWQPNYLFDNNAINSPSSKNTWYKIAQIFEEIVEYAESIHSKVCIVTIPSTVQVDGSHYDFYRKATFRVTNELMTVDKPQQLLGEFTSKANIPYLNLLPHFKKAPNTSALYFENDDHLSNDGHYLAYQLVEERLLKPFMEGQLPETNANAIDDYSKKYTSWAVEFTAEQIRNDASWMEKIKEKATEQEVTVDSMVMMDARYMVENAK